MSSIASLLENCLHVTVETPLILFPSTEMIESVMIFSDIDDIIPFLSQFYQLTCLIIQQQQLSKFPFQSIHF